MTKIPPLLWSFQLNLSCDEVHYELVETASKMKKIEGIWYNHKGSSIRMVVRCQQFISKPLVHISSFNNYISSMHTIQNFRYLWLHLRTHSILITRQTFLHSWLPLTFASWYLNAFLKFVAFPFKVNLQLKLLRGLKTLRSITVFNYTIFKLSISNSFYFLEGWSKLLDEWLIKKFYSLRNKMVDLRLNV